jgi:enoyl-CoA hydratase
MTYEILGRTISDGIATITISRPQAMNALNSRFFDEMDSMLGEMEKSKDIRVLIITGDGKAFVAGADISEMSAMNSDQGKKFSLRGQSAFSRIENLPFPVIAAVNGFALGGGCELALSCDIRVASVLAKFGQPEVNLGLIPGYAGTQRLSRIAGISNALHLILTGDMITAEEAFRMGIVQKVADPEMLMEVAMELAKKIASKGEIAVKEAKRVVREGADTTFNNGCKIEADAFGNLFGNGESGEGMGAFLEKRKPNW